jgi:NAD(P) transhydrogenase subunit alpha
MKIRTTLLLAGPAAVSSLAAVAYAATESWADLTASPPVAAAAAGVEHPNAGESLDIVTALFVFMLASFIGLGVIRRVSRLLHTPLMSLTNAISAIAVVGAILVTGNPHYSPGMRLLGAVALFASMTNIVSGFLITQRMLVMFKSREKEGR